MIRAPQQLPGDDMYSHRKLCWCAQAFYFVVILLFSLATLATCELQGEYSGCESFSDDNDADFRNVVSEENLRFVSDNLGNGGSRSVKQVCWDSNLFCFPSTLPGLLPPDYVEPESAEVSGAWTVPTSPTRSNRLRTNISWSSNCGIIKFSSGKSVSCSVNYEEGCGESSGFRDASVRDPLLHHRTQNVESNKQWTHRDDTSPSVEISPPLLDWGQKFLYFPSLAFIEVINTHTDDTLIVYEPYSPSSQFYPCNSSEVTLQPGEAVSVCFVYSPTWLGLSSSQILLQTSFGGFLIQATGFAVESPYEIQPLLGLDVSPSGKWRKNLSLYNPFDEALYVDEVIVSISVSSGEAIHSTKTVCSMRKIEDQHELSLLTVPEWIDVKSSEVGLPVVSLRPQRNWEVGPLKTETIMELDFSFPGRGKILGAFSLQLQRSSKDEIETVVVPLEAQHGASSVYVEHGSPVSLSLQALAPCHGTGTVVNLSMKNDASYVLRVVKISVVGERRNHLRVKYIEGLVLFPSTATQIASVSFEMLDPDLSAMKASCELLVLTNDTSKAEIKVPCGDIVRVCSSQISDSSVGSAQNFEDVGRNDIRAELSSIEKQQQQQLNEALAVPEADELILMNWKSHATASGMSVLDDDEVVFPVVEVGSHSSAFVTVKNPSNEPIVMQLILHSGEIIDECKAVDGFFQPSFFSSLIGLETASSSKHGFSVADGALTEAIVHPFSTVSMGPLLFQPSARCSWRSSVLVRNNLSGVEWLSLRGIGGSFSMVLLEESELVQSLDFKLSFPTQHTSTSLDTIHACSQLSSKEMYALNTGELPLEIRSIRISGTECGLDGFAVQTCKGFVLEPNNTIKLTLTYQPDFSAATIHRDLELALATGILVIPMKASLPLYMLSCCKKTIFWMRVKRSMFAIFLTASVVSLVVCFFFPYVTTFSAKSSISAVNQSGKSPFVHQSHRGYGKLALSSRMNFLLRFIGEDKSSLLEAVNRSEGGETVPKEEEEECKPAAVFSKSSSFKDTEKGVTLSPCVSVKNTDAQESPEAGNLMVKTGKDKGRRRKKKKKNSVNGVAGLFEVSSSQSGNSTPSSPMSPISSFTPKKSLPVSPEVNHTPQSRNPFVAVAFRQTERKSSSPEPKLKASVLQSESAKARGISTQEKLQKKASNPVLSPSASFPSASRPVDSFRAARPSFLAPHARAPGSKLYDQKAMKSEDKFRYDIWGDHIFGVSCMDRFKNTPAHTTGNTSYSFFVRGPQAPLSTKAQPETVKCYDEVG